MTRIPAFSLVQARWASQAIYPLIDPLDLMNITLFGAVSIQTLSFSRGRVGISLADPLPDRLNPCVPVPDGGETTERAMPSNSKRRSALSP